MAIKMVRRPSEEPNIKNTDDIIPFRYAYGNQNGYVIGKGNELSYTVNGSSFIINSGRIVLQGVESDVDANGFSITFETVSETRYYVVYNEVNLSTNTSDIKTTFDTTTYPTISFGDDLTSNSNGVAYLELYRFSVNSGIINNIQKIVKPIIYGSTNVNGVFIIENESHQLKANDFIVPKKSTLYENETGLEVSQQILVFKDEKDLNNRIFEVEFSTSKTQIHSFLKIKYINGGSYLYPAGSLGINISNGSVGLNCLQIGGRAGSSVGEFYASFKSVYIPTSASESFTGYIYKISEIIE